MWPPPQAEHGRPRGRERGLAAGGYLGVFSSAFVPGDLSRLLGPPKFLCKHIFLPIFVFSLSIFTELMSQIITLASATVSLGVHAVVWLGPDGTCCVLSPVFLPSSPVFSVSQQRRVEAQGKEERERLPWPGGRTR